MTEKYYQLNILAKAEKAPVFIYLSSPDMSRTGEEILALTKKKTTKAFSFCELQVKEWDRYFTPWRVEESLKDREFMGEGDKMLEALKEEIVPLIDTQLPAHGRLYIIGYSLAGLFALYALYEGGPFAGAASCSGSIWYPRWEEYIKEKTISQEAAVYLSLGKKEAKNTHPLMKKVGANTELQYEYLKNNPLVSPLEFEWNEGGHFSNVEERIVKAILKLLT